MIDEQRCRAGLQIDRLARHEARSKAPITWRGRQAEIIRVLSGKNVERSAAIIRNDRVELPSAQNPNRRLSPLLKGRQNVDCVSYEVVPAIEVGVALVEAVIKRVGRRAGERSQRYIGYRVRQSVRDRVGEPASEATVQPHLETVIPGVTS